MTGTSRGIAYALLAFAPIGAASNVSVSAWLREVPPGTLAFLRWTVASIVLGPLLLGSRSPLPLARGRWRALWGMALLGPAAIALGIAAASRMAPSGHIALVNASLPLWIVLAGALAYGDRMSAAQGRGLALAMIGVALVLVPGLEGAAGTHEFVGLGVALVGIVGYAVYSARLRLLPRELSGTRLVALLAPLAALWSLPFAVLEVARDGWPSVTANAVAGVVWVGVVASALAVAAWAEGVRRVGSTRAAVFFALLPPAAMLFSWILMRETPGPADLAGCVLVAAGLFVSTR